MDVMRSPLTEWRHPFDKEHAVLARLGREPGNSRAPEVLQRKREGAGERGANAAGFGFEEFGPVGIIVDQLYAILIRIASSLTVVSHRFHRFVLALAGYTG